MNNTDNGQEDEKTERSFKEAQTVTGENYEDIIALFLNSCHSYTLSLESKSYPMSYT